ncbi:hypothetical protein FA13DRAFT_1489099 [Coprinellus micaceus]|uniref:Uncharacterized protein n=1 Tax=Coprinellus micaceus TaxID=71717 RepID=A0A4Y7TM30_COPMI|nr:hypothetical protein FA13DRAFT_1489099 [Coprinellus micaceus]
MPNRRVTEGSKRDEGEIVYAFKQARLHLSIYAEDQGAGVVVIGIYNIQLLRTSHRPGLQFLPDASMAGHRTSGWYYVGSLVDGRRHSLKRSSSSLLGDLDLVLGVSSVRVVRSPKTSRARSGAKKEGTAHLIESHIPLDLLRPFRIVRLRVVPRCVGHGGAGGGLEGVVGGFAVQRVPGVR